jgi:uncharacterized membrane protein
VYVCTEDRPNVDERRIHQIFVASVILKGIDAAVETLSGLAMALVSQTQIVAIARWLTRHELIEDPHDFIANMLLHGAEALSLNAKAFYAYYMASHGAIKLVMVAGLLANRLWAYPFGLVVMVLFIAYQAYEYAQTHAIAMLALTAFDLIVLWLIWHEYKLVRQMRRKVQNHKN